MRILARDGHRCTHCGASVRGKGGARIDHIVPLREAPGLAYEPTNLRTLCTACDARRHREKGNHDAPTAWRPRIHFGSDERGYPLKPGHAWSK
jgi:5-methylcytosine-specific restriction endonuclease McrA